MNAHQIDIDLIREWIKLCDECHTAHGEPNLPPDISSRPGLPRWLYLVDLQQQCLVQVPCSANPQYIAVSYVWGQVDMLQTTVENLEQLQKPGSLLLEHAQPIPRTVTDAMHLASKLGCPYFWTDCLCIVQNDDVTKGQFIKAMSLIYARSYLTIVAGEGHDGNFGIPGTTDFTKPRDIKCRYLKFPGCVMMTEHIVDYMHQTECIGTVWQSRGWTFQEAFFSRRLLVFNGTVTFICERFESQEWQFVAHGDKRSSISGDIENRAYPEYISGIPTWPSLKQLIHIIAPYNKRNLTYDDDIVSAFSGVATIMQQAFYTGFHFGLPELFFDAALLWEFDKRNPEPPQQRKPQKSMLPSWSWMNAKGSLFLGLWLCFGNAFYNDVKNCAQQYELRPLVQWRKRVRGTGETKMIEYPIARDQSCMPPGWTFHTKLKGRTFYTHSSDSSSQKYPYPFPFPDKMTERCLNLFDYEPILEFEADRAWLKRAEAVDIYPGLEYRMYGAYNLRDKNGKWVGGLSSDRMDGCKGETEQCELIVISKSRVCGESQISFSLWEWDLDEHPSGDQVNPDCSFYNVIWIRREEGRCFRKGIARVLADDWEKLDLERIHVELG
ncbi:Heterokaryon incompatibility [Penicillium italicum]|uniref:Heterokaryon incompatibility n=1 Tax=Penicillium italicum TaxID=40296 RepID=A0A0A2KKX2_PENIT|nr:Heterokaryon incompatibility [Penicillium italicum]